MKNKLALCVTGGLSATLLITSIAFSQAKDQKKERHIKLKKIENGQKMELDTVLYGDDVFVWNGDTINPEKDIRKFSPSEFDKEHNGDGNDGKKRIRIHKMRDGKEPMIIHTDSGEVIHIISEEGDSTHQKISIRKRGMNGEERDHFIYLNGEHGEHFPPMPPMPDVPRVTMFRERHADRSINLNDPNIISFKKKKISGDREKIEIIRKRTNENEDMKFDFRMDHGMDVPEPPMPPKIEYHEKSKADSDRMKQEVEVEKQMNVKKMKENQTRENK